TGMAYHVPIRWVILPGNHDSLQATELWAHLAADAPGNVVLATEQAPIDLGAGAVLLPAPCTTRRAGRDLSAWMDDAATAEGAIRIGLAHGAIQIFSEDAGASEVIAPDRARRAGLDYLALGDWHGALEVDSRTHYSGTPEQDRFRGNEPGYALDVRIAAPGATPQVERVPTGKYRWSAWTETLSLPTDAQALAERLAALRAEDVLRLELQGHVNVPTWEALQRAVDQAAAQARAVLPDFSGLL
ncbi:metallophosphoesterase family protein, partial [Motilimonas pumila]|uniref:metallophosphoesterase family protein n=1 Tax=Motilimonas pumila TaxID=2303987 RepID=UPI001E59785B